MIKSPNQIKLNDDGIIGSLGRKPSKLELEVIRHFYYSKYASDPIPELSNLTSYGQNTFTISNNSHLVIGAESKGAITATSALRPLKAFGIKPSLRYQSKHSKITFGVAKSSHIEKNQLEGNEELILIQDSSQLVQICAEMLKLKKSSIKEIAPSSLGDVLNSLAGNQFGLDLHLSSISKISLLSDKKIHGVLVVGKKNELNKIKYICKKYRHKYIHLGRLKNVQFLTISIRKTTKAHLLISILNIPEPPRTGIVPAIQERDPKKQLKSIRELKNYSSQTIKIWQKIKKIKHERFMPKRSQIDSLGIIKKDSMVAVSIPDNLNFHKKDIKNGSRINTFNAARKLVSRGYKPLTAVLIISAKDIEKNDTLWNIQELFTGVYDALQHIGIRMAKPVISTHSSSKLDMELCVIGTKTFEHDEDLRSFKNVNDFITLLGSHRGELNSSFYQENIQKHKSDLIPTVDQQMEARLQETVLQGIQTGLIKTAANVSRGGIAAALIRSLNISENGLGARIHLSRKLRQDEMLFGETQGMVIVSIGERDLMEFERICMTIGIPSMTIGRVTDDGRFKFNDVVNIDRKKL